MGIRFKYPDDMPEIAPPRPQSIRGSGGSLGGGGSSKGQGVESDNTLRSNAFVRIVELLGEGQIVGLINGGCSIYFNQTPVVNLDNTVNFRGVQWESRVGLPDQLPMLGNATAENLTTVNVQVQAEVPPTVVTIVDAEATSARVIVRVPSLMTTDKNGNINPTSVSWVVECQPTGGGWIVMDRVDLVNQKCSSPYEQQSVFQLPVGGSPWNLRVRRLTPDSTTIELQNETWWDSYTSVVQGLFTYPFSALVGITVNAELFSATFIPTRSFHVKGLIIQVPTNYDPGTRTYTGIWDGTFKMAYSNNPVWVLYDLLTHNRYGLGSYIDASKIDKWGLFQVSQYCDEIIPNGFGGTEPRYTFNGVINNREEAFKVIQTITASFRGMAYWSVGQVFATADMPEDAVKLVSPVDVIDGNFSYSGTALKARHSAALVKWNDPNAFYAPTVELVVNDAQLAQFNWREVNVIATGCTSRGQAHRMGKWILDTEQFSTETVEYVASWDHIDIKPGQIISVFDPNKAQVRSSGRVILVSGTSITLDQPFTPTEGETYNLLAEMPDGSIQSRVISSFVGAIVNIIGVFTQTPVKGAMWGITGTEVNPRQYRVISISEQAQNLFKVTALFYDPTKYARVEENINLAPISYSQPKTTVDPPSNLQIKETVYFLNGVAQNRVTLSWTPSDDFLASGYAVTGLSPNGGGTVNFGVSKVTSLDIDQPAVGNWTFNLQSVGYDGRVSTNVSISTTIKGWAAMPPPYVSHLEVFDGGNDNTFGGQDCHVIWENNFPGSTFDAGQEPPATGAGSSNVNPFYRCNIVQVIDTTSGTVLRTETIYTSDFIYTFDKNVADNLRFNRGPQRSFTVSVVVQDNLGNQSAAVSIIPNNPPPPVIIPQLSSGSQALFVNYVQPADADFTGAFIWYSTNPNFDPATTTPAYQGANNFVSLPGVLSTVYYVRVAGYDTFGTNNLNVSPPYSIEVGGFILDTSPPDVPTTLVLSAGLITLPTGEVQQILTAGWDASPSANFGYFDAEIQDGAGGFVSYQTALNSFSWSGLVAGHTYTVKVRAVSKNNYESAFCAPSSLLMPAKSTAPGLVTGLTIAASLRSAYLQWTNPVDADLDHIEIWFGTTNVEASAALAGSSYSSAFTQTGLATGVTLFYWVRAVNTSGIASAFTGPVSVTPGVVATGDIAAGSITADRLVAGSITGNLLNISTSFPATITVGSTGVTIGDPAALINHNNTTMIAPGLIQLVGATSLASWQSGADATKIDGGSIGANTIAANTLTIGLRGLTITGLQFSFNSGTSIFAWAAGTITYLNDAGASVLVNIAAGSATFSGAAIYVWWVKDAVTLTTGSAPSASPNVVNFASYSTGPGMIVTYGRTIIDGSNIVGGSINAGQIAANAITATQIAAGSITAGKIAAGAITADLINGGTIVAATSIFLGGNQFALSAANQQLVVSDLQGTPKTRVVIGKIGAGTTDYGIQVFDASGAVVFSTGSSSVIAASAVTGLGAFASLSQITSANASTYIAAAAITDAMIINLSASKITVSNLSALSADLGSVTAGTITSADGKTVLDLNASTFTISD